MDNLYLAAVTSSGANSLTTFKLTDDSFTKASAYAFPQQNSGLHLSKDMSHALSCVQSTVIQVLPRTSGYFGSSVASFDVGAIPSAAVFSPDDSTAFIGSGYSPYYAQLFRKNQSGFGYTKLATLDASGGSSRCAFSEDGKYLVFMHSIAPYIKFYKIEGSVVTKLTAPTNLTDSLSSIAFTKDAAHVIAGMYFSPFLKIFKRVDDTLSEVSVASLPTSRAEHVAISPDGTHLAMALTGAPRLAIYKISGDTFTLLANPSVVPTNAPYGIFYSPDGQHLVVIQYSSPGVNIYKRNGDTYTRITTDPIVAAGSYVYSAAYSPDGGHLAIGTNEPPFLVVLKRNGDTYTRSYVSGAVPSAVVDTKFFWLRAPKNLSGARGASSIQWTWSPVLGASNYQIEYGPVGGPYLTTTASPSFTQSGLTHGVEYEARVRAID